MNSFKLPSRVQSYRHITATGKGTTVRHRTAIAVICTLTLVAGFVLIGMSRASNARSNTHDSAAAVAATVQNPVMADPRYANVIGAMAIEQGRLVRGAESTARDAAVAAPAGNVVDMTY